MPDKMRYITKMTAGKERSVRGFGRNTQKLN